MRGTKDKTLRVAELFAGVGGFRLGLEGSKNNRKKHNKYFKTVWFNQWEPSTKRQHAHETYVKNFGDIDEQTKIDISKVNKKKIPDHDLLVGGFPCQDYSVARSKSGAKGIVGKKGTLWWSIHDVLTKKGKNAPNYLMLENVDRLIKSPSSERGRDFAIMLSTLNSLNYIVEWRVINASDYGMPQRRRRVFILAYKKGSSIYKKITSHEPESWLTKKGVVQRAFPSIKKDTDILTFDISSDVISLSEKFDHGNPKKTPFENSGMAICHKIYTIKTIPDYKGSVTTLGAILINEKDITKEYYINKKEDLKKWKYLKGSKKEKRRAKNGFNFIYSEGSMTFPDALDKPSRTIVTGEGGQTPSRFKHAIKTKKGLRRLTPVELERLCMFPDNHTEGQSNTKRAFFMGNALVVGVVDKLGDALSSFHFKK